MEEPWFYRKTWKKLKVECGKIAIKFRFVNRDVSKHNLVEKMETQIPTWPEFRQVFIIHKHRADFRVTSDLKCEILQFKSK